MLKDGSQNSEKSSIREGIPFLRGDILLPFLLEQPNIRGRIVRLDETVNSILSSHDYPYPVSLLLGGALALTSLLAGMLKFEGVFSFQVKGSAAVPTLICDISHDGNLRGYAAFDAQAIADLETSSNDLSANTLIGDGYLAFTVDQGKQSERYQGLVEMQGENMEEWVRHYFSQSEQIKTAFQIDVDRDDNGYWRAAAMMLQSLPDKAPDQTHVKTNIEADAWRRVMMLMDTVTKKEMLSSELALQDVLFRLFHEETVRIYDPLELKHACRCNLGKIETILISLSEEEIKDYTLDNKIEVDCQFCSKKYSFTEGDIRELREKGHEQP